MKNCIEEFTVKLYDGKTFTDITNQIITEAAFDLFLNNEKLITIACAGIHLRELAVGFLHSNGMLQEGGDITGMEVSDTENYVAVTTGKSVPFSSYGTLLSSGAREIYLHQTPAKLCSQTTVTAQKALQLMEELLNTSAIHEMTRGTHCSALADRNGIIVSREDIGRHNTIDMLGGYALLEGIDCADRFILTTGRISSEIVQKVKRIGSPIIISHSAPTSRAIRMAQAGGITLIGYVRNGKMKIYSNENRVIT